MIEWISVEVVAAAELCRKTSWFLSFQLAQRISAAIVRYVGLLRCLAIACVITSWSGEVAWWNAKTASILCHLWLARGQRKNKCQVDLFSCWRTGQVGEQTFHVAPCVLLLNPKCSNLQSRVLVRGWLLPVQTCLQTLLHCASDQSTPHIALNTCVQNWGAWLWNEYHSICVSSYYLFSYPNAYYEKSLFVIVWNVGDLMCAAHRM